MPRPDDGSPDDGSNESMTRKQRQDLGGKNACGISHYWTCNAVCFALPIWGQPVLGEGRLAAAANATHCDLAG